MRSSYPREQRGGGREGFKAARATVTFQLFQIQTSGDISKSFVDLYHIQIKTNMEKNNPHSLSVEKVKTCLWKQYENNIKREVLWRLKHKREK